MIPTKHDFPIGSEWLYFKIYTGPKLSDHLLSEIIYPLAQEFFAEKKISKWFFIRYGDPDHHLRVRFRLSQPEYLSLLLIRLQEHLSPLINEHLIWKFQTDTYQREIQRYGQDKMEVTESLFHHHSELTVQLIDLIEGDEGEQIRWLFGLRWIDDLLQEFGLNLQQKFHFLEQLRNSFETEFHSNKHFRKQLKKKYAAQETLIQQFLHLNKENAGEYEPLLDILEQHSKQIRPLIPLLGEGLETPLLIQRLSSYIHMMMNRLFRSRNRAHEMVIYFLLSLYYKSEVAKVKYQQGNLVES